MASIKPKLNKDGTTSFLIEVYCGRDSEGKKMGQSLFLCDS